MTAPLRRAFARLNSGEPVQPAPTAPHQQHPGGTNTPAVAAVAPIADAAAPVADELAAALRQIGLDETEIRTYPDPPSIFQRFNALHETVERIASLLAAQQHQAPIYEAIAPQVAPAGIQLHKHGRRFVGIRAGQAQNLQAETTAGIITLAVSATMTYWQLRERTTITAKTAADAQVNYEFVYTDDIGGAVPQ